MTPSPTDANHPIEAAMNTDDKSVICPCCAHQFRGIPTQVQRLLLTAGHEPPFCSEPAEGGGVDALLALPGKWRDRADNIIARDEYNSGRKNVYEQCAVILDDALLAAGVRRG